MINKQVEDLLRTAIDQYIHAYKYNKLAFDDCGEDDGFNAYWSHDDNSWESINDTVDPLSLLLFMGKPIPYTEGDDCIATATVADYIGKSTGWLRSFQDGWYGRDNKSTSITGYLIGRKFRLEYLKAE